MGGTWELFRGHSSALGTFWTPWEFFEDGRWASSCATKGPLWGPRGAWTFLGLYGRLQGSLAAPLPSQRMFPYCSIVMLGGSRGIAGLPLATSDRFLGSLWRTRALLRVPWGGPWACSGPLGSAVRRPMCMIGGSGGPSGCCGSAGTPPCRPMASPEISKDAEDFQGIAKERKGVPRDSQGTQNDPQGNSKQPPREPELHR